MEEVSYTGAVIASLLYLVAGLRLIRRGMRLSETPEHLLGTVFVLWSLYYYLDILPYLLVDESLLIPLFFAARVVIIVAMINFAMFTRQVFRSTSAWPNWLIVGSALCMIVGVGGSVVAGDPGGLRPLSNAWYWLEVVGVNVPFVWMATESLSEYLKARRRLRLNLCNALVCNRYLLWGLASAIWVGVEAVSIAESIQYELTLSISNLLDFLLMASELVAVTIVWFVFFPPAFYRRWIGRNAPAKWIGES